MAGIATASYTLQKFLSGPNADEKEKQKLEIFRTQANLSTLLEGADPELLHAVGYAFHNLQASLATEVYLSTIPPASPAPSGAQRETQLP
jgi:hypothetical protein